MKGDRNCQLCPLHETAQYVCLLGVGPQPAKAMMIGEAPGRREDDSGRPFVGRAGKLLDEMLTTVGLDRSTLFITNAVSCRPPDNRTPKKREIDACRHWVDYQMKTVRPKYVALMGNVALESVLHMKGIKKLRGRPIEKDGIIYLPMYHPSFILRGDGVDRPIAEQDLRTFKEIIEFGGIPYEREINPIIVDTWSKVDDMLSNLHGTVSPDLETTCLYPWAPEAAVVTIGLGTSGAEYIIPANHPESSWSAKDLEKIVKLVSEKLESCITIFQNGKFDILWMKVHYGVTWHNDFDTLLAHYILDENSRHDLESLSQLYFGAYKWDVPLPVKQGKEGSLRMLATYQAHDLYYTLRLRSKLKKLLEKDPDVYRVFRKILMPCANLFVEMEAEGCYIDTKKMDEVERHLRTEIAKAEKRLSKWGDINWASPKQVAELLYGKLKIKCPVLTEKGNQSTAESSLKQIEHPCVADLLTFRGHKQQLSFFIEGWKPFIIDKRIHPSFKLHGTVTGRPSAEHPNCIDGEAWIEIPGGRKKMKEIVPGDKVYCYNRNRKLVLSTVTWAGKTGVRETVKIDWHSSNRKGSLILTPSHLVRLSSGKYTEADRLKRGDRVISLRRRDCSNGYPELRIFDYKGPGVHHGWVDEHRVLFNLVHSYLPPEIHHKDETRNNNNTDNLLPTTRSLHMSYHASKDGRRRGLLAHQRNGKFIVAATIKARRLRAERECPTELVKKAWKKFGHLPKRIKLASNWLKVSRKTVERRWTKLGFTEYRLHNNHRVLSVIRHRKMDVYDITVDRHHNFIANEICVHNCQQVPRDPKIRSLIIAPPGYTLLEADLSQIELRIVAELSRIPSMMEAFTTGEDIHWKTALNELERYAGQSDLIISTAKTARGLSKSPRYAEAIEILREIGPDAAAEIDPVWKEMRKRAKAVGFGYIYGMWWKKFRIYARDNYDIHLTDREAQESRIAYFQLYPLENWHDEQRRHARRYGYVESFTGRKRRLPHAQDLDDSYERAEAWRQAINSPVQSFASDINLMVLLQVREEFPRNIVKPVITVHDSILIYVRNDYVRRVTRRIKEIMQSPALFKEFNIQLTVPICGDVKLGPWGLGISPEKWEKT